MAIIYHFPLETPDDKNLWTKGNVFSLIRFYLWEHPQDQYFLQGSKKQPNAI